MWRRVTPQWSSSICTAGLFSNLRILVPSSFVLCGRHERGKKTDKPCHLLMDWICKHLMLQQGSSNLKVSSIIDKKPVVKSLVWLASFFLRYHLSKTTPNAVTRANCKDKNPAKDVNDMEQQAKSQVATATTSKAWKCRKPVLWRPQKPITKCLKFDPSRSCVS